MVALQRSLANLAKRGIGELTALVKPGSDGCSTGVLTATADDPVKAALPVGWRI